MNNLISLQLEKLNPQQLEAVTTIDGPVIVTAGAGSGKTRVLTLRIANIVAQNKANLNEILAITFTNKAANEMKERVRNLIGGSFPLYISTFHSFCANFLRENVSALDGYTSRFTIYGDDEKNKLLKDICSNYSGVEDDFVKKLAYFISDAKNKNLSPTEYFNAKLQQDETYANDFLNCMQEYEKMLKKNNAFDFDDLLAKTYLLLKNNEKILTYYQTKFKYICIDEFQDTNTVQYDIAKLLASKHKNILVVGDEDQCIYGWRGANIANITNFIKDFSNCKIIKLEQNYRSTKRILNSANQVIKNNTERLDKQLRTDNDLGEDPVYYSADSETLEADYVARNILNLVKNYGYKYKDCAVLMRLNALSRSFEERFLTYNIPYKLFGGFKFFERQEIKSTLAYLKFLNNPHDSDAFARLVAFPKRGIGEATINTFKNYCYNNAFSLLEGVINLNQTSLANSIKNKMQPLSEFFLKLLEKYENSSLTDLIEFVIIHAGIKHQYFENTEENTNRLRNLDALVNSVNEFEQLNLEQATLQKYLETITLSSDIDNYDEDNNTVTLSTIHAVKGLEFKCVFIIGLEDGSFPLNRALIDFNEMQEERRLMYVAITRAEHKLFLTRAKSRYMYGDRKYTMPSQFLKEMGKEEVKNYLNTNSETNNFVSKVAVSDVHKFVNAIKEKQKNMFVSNGDKKDYSKFVVGVKVSHPKFGEGTIIDNSELESKKCIKIEFEDFGVKNLIVDFAPIEILN